MKASLHRQRCKTQPPKASSISNVVVHDTNTADGEPFLIHDNKKANRILVFAKSFFCTIKGCIFHLWTKLIQRIRRVGSQRGVFKK